MDPKAKQHLHELIENEMTSKTGPASRLFKKIRESMDRIEMDRMVHALILAVDRDPELCVKSKRKDP